ncbi:MAG TPA: PEP/pyruvate-binding domain-containing protein [Anaerolineae bacterium]|nr:PEP/pyruvate-binding domain-containing protein [Anaerolineae bacterium]
MMNKPRELGFKPLLTLPTSQDVSTRRILDLDEIEGTDLALVGGKAFRLAQVRKYGLSVPPGLVLTTEFFKAQITAAKLTPLWAGSPDIAVTAEALNWLADALKLKPLAGELSAELENRLQLAFSPDINSFAVRSSVIDEDHRDHSFAGMHLTELGVPRSALPIAITRCWASALSGPTVKYRQVHGLSIQGIRVALIIQPLLSSEISGVAFTVNPLTGARDEIIIEATWGLGNSLVAGQIQPYYYKIAAQPPDYPIIEQHIGTVTPVSTKEPSETTQPLTIPQIADLARQLEQIQALMGEPQDIEWAYQDHQSFILQTRPAAVVTPTQPTSNLEWTHHGYAQYLPPLPSPLFGALLDAIQPQVIRFLTKLGLNVEHLPPLEKFILGRPYLNLTLIKAVMAQVGVTSGSLLHLLGDTKAAVGPTFTIDWTTAWAARSIYRAIWLQTRRLTDTLTDIQKAVNRAISDLGSSQAGLSSDQLLAQLRQQPQCYGQIKAAQLTLTLGRIILTGLGAKLLTASTPTPITTLTTAATHGTDLAQERLHHRLVELGQWVHSQSVGETSNHTLNHPKNCLQSEEFNQKFKALLTQYGHHATYDIDPGQPRYLEAPDALLALIVAQAQNDPGQYPTEAKRATELSQLPLWRRWLLQPILAHLRNLLIKQDQLHENLVNFMTAVRQWHLTLGQTWSDAGWLETPDDIFWLTLEEIERTLRVEDGMAVKLSSTIQVRKETYDIYAQTSTPFVIKDTEVPTIQLGHGNAAGPTVGTDVFIGLPISPGQARGVVVVVRHPDEFNQIADNVILVMPSTDPAWLALLSSAAGLIVETGGLLSHGSVIAREYGLPAVANIPQATQRFQTGDTVLVDGSTGVIQLLEPSRSPSTTH